MLCAPPLCESRVAPKRSVACFGSRHRFCVLGLCVSFALSPHAPTSAAAASVRAAFFTAPLEARGACTFCHPFRKAQRYRCTMRSSGRKLAAAEAAVDRRRVSRVYFILLSFLLTFPWHSSSSFYRVCCASLLSFLLIFPLFVRLLVRLLVRPRGPSEREGSSELPKVQLLRQRQLTTCRCAIAARPQLKPATLQGRGAGLQVIRCPLCGISELRTEPYHFFFPPQHREKQIRSFISPTMKPRQAAIALPLARLHRLSHDKGEGGRCFRPRRCHTGRFAAIWAVRVEPLPGASLPAACPQLSAAFV